MRVKYKNIKIVQVFAVKIQYGNNKCRIYEDFNKVDLVLKNIASK